MYRAFFKYLLDFIIALTGILILLPVFLFVTVLLYIANNGEAFFLQERPGKHGRIFKIIKFKTMNNAKDDKGRLLPDANRLTSIGKFVRKTSIDEIPQLFNIIKGEMSIVGPRPLLPEYLNLYTSRQQKRHEVRPGITGWAQVNGRNAISWTKKLNLDAWYVENISLWLDVKILWLTLVKVLKSEGINTRDMATTEPFNGEN